MKATAKTARARESSLEYRLFDADNHYYEPEDAFLRYMAPSITHKAPRWVQMMDGKSKRLVFGDRMNRFVGADHTFGAVGQPGVQSRGEASGAEAEKPVLEPPRPEYRERDARLALMDRQGLEATMLFPSLGVSVEQLIVDDIEATYANLHAFNQWIDDDWGFCYKDRIYGVPLLSLLDPFSAVEELEFVIERGARCVNLRPGPVAGRSPADRIYDRFWATAAEGNVAVVFHASDESYRYDMAKLWGWGNVNVPARNIPPVQRVIAGHDRCIHDTMASLLYGKLFERFPSLRVAAIELGCAWVPDLFEHLEEAGRGDLAEDPVETFRRHVWVAPFEHEDLVGLAAAIGTDRILFGSDFPHTDGLAEPASFADHLKAFDDDAVRKIMRENAFALIGAPTRGS